MKSSTPRKEQFLSVQDAGIRFNDRELFCELNFSLQKGDVIHIIGPNGSGKTTLLKILCGLLLPDTGLVHRTQEAHFLGHKDALADELSVKDMLRWYSCILPGNKKGDDMDTILMQLGLHNHRDTLCSALSAGERKLCCLARLLFLPRAIWLLDEPFIGLAQEKRAIVGQLFDKHKEEGSIVYSDHSDAYSKAKKFYLKDFYRTTAD